jgi:hypothetical protein
MDKRIKIDLPERTERRYVIPSPQKFLDKISSFMERKKFSDNEYVQTIYFNNDEHTLPFDLSIKARRYLPRLPSHPVLDEGLYFLELKIDKGEYKQKVRMDAAKIINEEYSFLEKNLRPYILVEYHREHYTLKNQEKARVTIDDNIKYFYLPPNQKKWILIGKEEDYARLEVKEKRSNKNFSILIKKILEDFDVRPIISKRFTSYNFLNKYFLAKNKIHLYKELNDCEIESKLEIKNKIDPETVFQEIKQYFKKNNSKFKLPKHFPRTLESASINRYCKNKNGLFKISMKGDKMRIIFKSKKEILKNSKKLTCILKRKERKGDYFSIWSKSIESAELLEEIKRKKKFFYIVNSLTKRFYQISLDYCYNYFNKNLRQIEIEYIGRSIKLKTAEENKIVEDIAKITEILLKKFPALRPSQQTKEEWLRIK